jgi:periplasmic protein TonB
MKTDAILKADVLDIIFENKNKSYGAYTLRKFYNNRLYKALGVMFSFVLVLCSFTLIKTKPNHEAKPLTDTTFTVKTFDNEPKKAEPIRKKENQIVAAKKPTVVKTDAFTTVKITNTAITLPVQSLREDAVFGDARTDIPTGGELPKVTTIPLGGGGDTGKVVIPEKPKVDKVTPKETAEIMPSFPGGMEALRKFLQKNLANPQDLEEGETVSVKIRFIVGYDGVLKGFETIEDGGSAFNNEVMRVLKKMPEWTAGRTKGETVSVYYTIPVKFTSN